MNRGNSKLARKAPATAKNAGENPHVEFRGVEKSFDGLSLVVQNLDLTIARGEFLTLLGPSGSGKTTTLLMLAGFEPPTAGEIFVSGRAVSRLPPHKRNIGMVFQNYALFPHMTVRENLAFPLEVRRMARAEIEDRVKRALDMVELPRMQDRRPNQLSGGQQQRIAVARALVFEPELVLMDEPLGALDKQLREQMQYEIKRIHDRVGVTFVYVTHDQAEALTMSDRIAVFRNGVVQQLAAPDDIYERPTNSFVAQFIGENNRLHGRIRAIDGDLCRVELDGGEQVTALAGRPPTVDQPTMLSLRPERVLINPPAGSVSNALSGRIEELIYVGDHIRVRMAIAGSADFIVKVPNKLDAPPLALGDEVTVGWTAEDCRALDPM
jgi:putative spermidine/putrescine transport system ATP-binding protein